MEKKPNSLRPTAAKGQTSESRKSQDVTKGRQRSGRSRESANFSNSKSEPIRATNKQTALRPTTFDKRQRQHGIVGDGYQRSVEPSAASSSSYTGLDSSDEHEPLVVELNSVYTPGSKKHNLNHLLNFNYAPRDRHDPIRYSGRGGGGNGRHWSMCGGRRLPRYNKEQFLQATCQFVVNAGFDYDVYRQCPDVLVEWEHVEQVNIQTTEEPQCPICLYPPVAGKMTRCGHVYCWPCILHYLSLSDQLYRKCPICYESIYTKNLKSAVSKPHKLYNVGDVVTLQLMCREKTALNIFNVNRAQRRNLPYLSDDEEYLMHSKLVLANNQDIMTIIDREYRELNGKLTRDGLECPESVFIQQALHLLQERQSAIKFTDRKVDKMRMISESEESGIEIEQKMHDLKLNVQAKPFTPRLIASTNVGTESLSQSETTSVSDESERGSDAFVIDQDTNLTLEDIQIIPMAKDSKHFYFYQASDGQHLYLHSINVRMLEAMYGGLDRAPYTIHGRVLQKESCSLTDDLRKRLKYLQHLPVTSQFDVVEIELDATVVSNEILVKFKDELLLRKKNRQRRAREERQREKHINEVNDRQLGKLLAMPANIDVTSERQFPSCGSFDVTPNFEDEPFLHPSSMISTSTDHGPTSSAGASFATMLSGQVKVDLWPTLGPTKAVAFDDPTNFKSLQANSRVLPNKARQQSYNSDLEEENDGYDEGMTKIPAFKSSFGTAIAQSLNAKSKQHQISSVESRSSLNENGNGAKSMSSTNASGGPSNVGGKKKKIKKTILFSTSARPFDGK